MTHLKFIISRIWRNGQVIVPVANTVIKMGDSLLVVTSKEDEDTMVVLFGKQVEKDWNGEQIDWNAIESHHSDTIAILQAQVVAGQKLDVATQHTAHVDAIGVAQLELP